MLTDHFSLLHLSFFRPPDLPKGCVRSHPPKPVFQQSLISLRPCTEDDGEFLVALFIETSAALFARLALPPDQKRKLLELQLRAREQGWRSQYPHGKFQIVRAEGKPAGYFAHDHGKDRLQLIYLGLLKKYQGRGIAAGLVRELQQEALMFCLPIAAHVESGNPALGFWKHLGFGLLENTGVHDSIQWDPK